MPSMWERNIVSFYIRDAPFATRSVPFGIYIFHSQSIVKTLESASPLSYYLTP